MKDAKRKMHQKTTVISFAERAQDEAKTYMEKVLTEGAGKLLQQYFLYYPPFAPARERLLTQCICRSWASLYRRT